MQLPRRACLVLLLVAAAGAAGARPAASSAVGGQAAGAAAAKPPSIDSQIATKWLAAGRGYDWSRAGYKGGEAAINTQSLKTFNIKTTYRAAANGVTLDDAAVKSAISAAVANGGGVVYFPAGTYALSMPVFANASNIVLKGDGVGRTKLLFTRSLSGVYGGTWGVDPCTGKIKSAWAFGGGMVMLSGRNNRLVPPAVLAKVIRQAQPGANVLQVNTTEKIQVGQWVQLRINDASTIPPPGTNGTQQEIDDCQAYYGQGKRTADAGAAAAGPRIHALPMTDKLRRDPIFLAAIEASFAANDDDDQGFTPEQVAAFDAQSGGQSDAGAAAADGTVAAWIYGGNILGPASSGGTGAINGNSVRFVARVVAKGRTWVQLDRDIVHLIKAGWTAELTEHQVGIENSGVEQLTIQFKDSGKYGAHLTDKGYNGVHLERVNNCWVRNVEVVDGDNGVFVSSSDFVTISDVKITTTNNNPTWRASDSNGFNGHHAIGLGLGQSNLVTRCNFAVRFHHDFTVDASAMLSVFSSSTGLDLNMDNHRAGSWANLFTNNVVGANNRPFESSGRQDRGAHTGRGSTFWNNRAGNGARLALPTCDFGPLLNFVGSFTNYGVCRNAGWYVAALPAGGPVDLFAAQVAERQRLKRKKAAV